MKKFSIFIIGHGKLALELLQGLAGPAISRVIRWEERDSQISDRCMVVHAGSGRELDGAIEFCSLTGSVFLDLSTGDYQLPVISEFPAIICPNVNLQMLYFMAMIKNASKYFKCQDINISESHQSSKNTRPATAIYLAKQLGIPENEIQSERDPKVQNEHLGIPSSYLDRHAYHEIVIKNPEVEIRLETRVVGKSAYASGLVKIIHMITKKKLSPGYYDIVDFISDAG